MVGKNKKGTHVGVVLSFILFVTFLVFLFAIIEIPLAYNQKKADSIDNIKSNLIDKISSDVTEVYIANLSTQSGEDCLRIDESNLGTIAGSKLFAEDKDGNAVSSIRESGYSYVSWSGESFFKLHYTPETINSSLSCSSSADGEIKNIKQTNEIFESKIVDAMNEYDSNYSSLKSEIGISSSDEFVMQFEYSNGTTLGKSLDNLQTNIYGKEYQIFYIGSNGGEKTGKLRIYLW